MHVLRVMGCTHFHMKRFGPQPSGPATEAGQCRVELLTDGHAWYDDGSGRLVEVGPGDLLWHEPGDRSICRNDPQDPYACLSVRFAINPDDPARPVPRHTRWTELDRVRTFTREVVHYSMDRRFDREALLHYCYGRLLFQAQRSVHLDRQPDLPAGLATVVERMRNRFNQECSIPAMAELAGCSQSHLHALFKQHFQTTPHQFLLERRLLAARKELAGSDDALATVARRCGFSDATTLCRAFKRATGASPHQWRAKERAQW